MIYVSNFELVKEFHTAMEMTHNVWPPTEKEIALRFDLIDEEFYEIQKELFELEDPSERTWKKNIDKQKIAKELADLLYVVYGTAVSFGIPLDKVFEEVHKSNMSKLVDGKPMKREDGKVLKGPNYQPPQLDHIFK